MPTIRFRKPYAKAITEIEIKTSDADRNSLRTKLQEAVKQFTRPEDRRIASMLDLLDDFDTLLSAVTGK